MYARAISLLFGIPLSRRERLAAEFGLGPERSGAIGGIKANREGDKRDGVGDHRT